MKYYFFKHIIKFFIFLLIILWGLFFIIQDPNVKIIMGCTSLIMSIVFKIGYTNIKVISLFRIFSIISLYKVNLLCMEEYYNFVFVIDLLKISDNMILLFLLIFFLLAEYFTYKKQRAYNKYNWIYWALYLMYSCILFMSTTPLLGSYDNLKDILYENKIFSIEIKYNVNFMSKIYEVYRRHYESLENVPLQMKNELMKTLDEAVAKLLKENPAISLESLKNEIDKKYKESKKKYLEDRTDKNIAVENIVQIFTLMAIRNLLRVAIKRVGLKVTMAAIGIPLNPVIFIIGGKIILIIKKYLSNGES